MKTILQSSTDFYAIDSRFFVVVHVSVFIHTNGDNNSLIIISTFIAVLDVYVTVSRLTFVQTAIFFAFTIYNILAFLSVVSQIFFHNLNFCCQ